jgi:hypothetical protein
MRSIFEDILSVAKDRFPEIVHVNKWGNQVEMILAGEYQMINLPAMFIEVVSPMTINQLGDGVQIYDPLYIRLHLVDSFYNEFLNDDEFSAMERNLEVFDLKQKMYIAFQNFRLSGGGGIMYRTSEEEEVVDTLCHYTQEFTTTFVDATNTTSEQGEEIYIDDAELTTTIKPTLE